MLKIGLALIIGAIGGALPVALAKNSALREAHYEVKKIKNVSNTYLKIIKGYRAMVNFRNGIIKIQENRIKDLEYLLKLEKTKPKDVKHICIVKGRPNECEDTCCYECQDKGECDWKCEYKPDECGHAVRK